MKALPSFSAPMSLFDVARDASRDRLKFRTSVDRTVEPNEEAVDIDDLEFRLDTEDRGVAVCERGDAAFGALCAVVEVGRVGVDRGNAAFLTGTETLTVDGGFGNAEFRNIVATNQSVSTTLKMKKDRGILGNKVHISNQIFKDLQQQQSKGRLCPGPHHQTNGHRRLASDVSESPQAPTRRAS